MGIEAKWKNRGIRVGKLPCGPLDKISDVPGVTVGHCTPRCCPIRAIFSTIK